MHSDIARGLAMLESVTQFHADHRLGQENERAEELFDEVGSAVVDLRTMGGTQDFNRRKVSGSSSERQQIAERMRKMMRQIARVAKVLDRVQYPDARFKLRVPRSNGYQPLLIRANVFLQTVATMKAEFTKRGMPADFDARLQALIDQFESATRRKNSSLSGQIRSTANMKERLRHAVRAVRELDVILGLLFEDDPARYSVWRSASHIHRAPRRGDKAPGAESPISAVKSNDRPATEQRSTAVGAGVASATKTDPGPPVNPLPDQPTAKQSDEAAQLALW